MPDESNDPFPDAGSTSGAPGHGLPQLDPWQRVLQLVAHAWSPRRWRDVGVVIGCSGGADSVCLVRALAELRQHDETPPNGFLIVAHFNHGLRADQSDGDETFVEQLAADLNLRYASQRGRGTVRDESGMRHQRLDFLTATAHKQGARYVALAHSADDNVETLLHHLLRGTGPSGLAGIRPFRPLGSDLILIRPLLGLRRDELRQALRSIGQAWREDPSNENIDYRRNWIRHQVIPLIEQSFPQACEAMVRAIEGQRTWRELIDSRAEDWVHRQLVHADPLTLGVDSVTPEAVVVAAFQSLWDQQGWPRQDMSQDHWQRLAQAVRSSRPDRFTLPGGIDVRVNDSKITVRR
jgi:tRNA(Ile)-lysidine synthase